MPLCWECGHFCSFGLLWPSGICDARSDALVRARAAACVMWIEDRRGADQSDGENPDWDGARAPLEADAGGGAVPSGASAPEGAKKNDFQRTGLVAGSRCARQGELF
mgnify:FL=1|jgi:hypothetical protein